MDNNSSITIRVDIAKPTWQVILTIDQQHFYDVEIPGNWEALGFLIDNIIPVLKSHLQGDRTFIDEMQKIKNPQKFYALKEPNTDPFDNQE